MFPLWKLEITTALQLMFGINGNRNLNSLRGVALKFFFIAHVLAIQHVEIYAKMETVTQMGSVYKMANVELMRKHGNPDISCSAMRLLFKSLCTVCWVPRQLISKTNFKITFII